jgi:hypothetical protein
MRPECINVRALSANEGSGTADWPLVAPLACFPEEEDVIAERSWYATDYVTVFFPFCLAAQRAFISADNFFFAAALIGRRTVAFFDLALACFGADFPFHLAHRCFIASEMRLRAAGLIRRGFQPVDAAFGRRPRLGAGEVSPSSAAIAWSIRLRSALRSETMVWMSMESSRMVRREL